MDPLDVSASGLAAQRKRLELIAQNLANAETTRTSAGGPYQRQVAVFSEKLDAVSGGGVEVSEVVPDPAPARRIYQPGHPDADAQGFVLYPNVNPMEEMVDMISTTRAYEANATAMSATKAMLRKTLDLARE
jgi:flagellar basal-body rod protein FlgC